MALKQNGVLEKKNPDCGDNGEEPKYFAILNRNRTLAYCKPMTMDELLRSLRVDYGSLQIDKSDFELWEVKPTNLKIALDYKVIELAKDF